MANNSPSLPQQGQRVRIVLTSGAEFEGTYSNGSEPTSCRLSMVQQKKQSNNSADITNGSARRESTMTIQRKDIADARVVAGNNTKNMNGTDRRRCDPQFSRTRLTCFLCRQPVFVPHRWRNLQFATGCRARFEGLGSRSHL